MEFLDCCNFLLIYELSIKIFKLDLVLSCSVYPWKKMFISVEFLRNTTKYNSLI